MQATAVDRQAKLFHLHNLLGALVQDAEAAADARSNNRPRGAVTGLSELDEALGGFLSVGVHVVTGPPGVGKTAAALQFASDCKAQALFLSCEMPRLELFRRLIARQTETFLHKLKNGELEAKEIQALAETTINELKHLAIIDATAGRVDVDFLAKCAEQLRDKGERVLVVVDSLQAFSRNVAPGLPEYESINAALTALANLAAELQVPIILISHRNRASNTSRNGATLHSGKGSGDIEYCSESILDISIEADAKDDAHGLRAATVKIFKNRNGAPGYEIPLKFCGRLQEFRQLER